MYKFPTKHSFPLHSVFYLLGKHAGVQTFQFRVSFSSVIPLSSTGMNCLSFIFSLGSLYFTLQSLSFDINPFSDTFTGLLYTETSTQTEMNKPIKSQFIHSVGSDCTANHQVSLLPCRMKSKWSLLYWNPGHKAITHTYVGFTNTFRAVKASWMYLCDTQAH